MIRPTCAHCPPNLVVIFFKYIMKLLIYFHFNRKSAITYIPVGVGVETTPLEILINFFRLESI